MKNGQVSHVDQGGGEASWPHLAAGRSETVVPARPGDRGHQPAFVGDESKAQGVRELLRVTGLEGVRAETQTPRSHPQTTLFLAEVLPHQTMRKSLAKAAPVATFPFCQQVQGCPPQHTHTRTHTPCLASSSLATHLSSRSPFRSRGSPGLAFPCCPSPPPRAAEGSLRPLLCGLVHSRAQRMVVSGGQVRRTHRGALPWPYVWAQD